MWLCRRTETSSRFSPGIVPETAPGAMEGLIELMLEKEGRVPDSDADEAIPRYNRLAHPVS